jgi:hypothetical protein
MIDFGGSRPGGDAPGYYISRFQREDPKRLGVLQRSSYTSVLQMTCGVKQQQSDPRNHTK